MGLYPEYYESSSYTTRVDPKDVVLAKFYTAKKEEKNLSELDKVMLSMAKESFIRVRDFKPKEIDSKAKLSNESVLKDFLKIIMSKKGFTLSASYKKLFEKEWHLSLF